MSEKYVANYESPLGNLEIISDNVSILACNFRKNEQNYENIPQILNQAVIQLKEYFDGKRKEFNLKLCLSGTEFQEKVWNELISVPFGKTISYKELAQRIGQEKAVRAVGNANGQNPISIIIPCHRVIGSDGKLVGYGGGIERKEWLLKFEQN